MDRKQFLGSMLVLPAGIFLVNCSSSSDTSDTNGADSNAPAAPPTQSNGMDVYTSNNVEKHTHTYSLDDAAITAPPANGASGDSSNDAGHTHSVAITMDQLTQVGLGQMVQITSGVALGHTHVFTFVKIA